MTAAAPLPDTPAAERHALERVVVAAALDDDDALLTALELLPPLPFRSLEAPELHVAFYWAAAAWANGTFDGLENRNRLLEAMERAGWPRGWSGPEREGWLDSALSWSPLIYAPAAVRSVCEVLRDLGAADDHLLEVRWRLQTNRHIRRALAGEMQAWPAPHGRLAATAAGRPALRFRGGV